MNHCASELLGKLAQCQACRSELPFQPRPVIQLGKRARLLIIGQAPGLKVHQTGIPWNDASGKRLRNWLALDETIFYDACQVAIMPMAFCYPGKGKSGDLPPPKRCAPLWHQQLRSQMPKVKLTLLVGQYAQNYYLKDNKATLTERVRRWTGYGPEYWPLPHPSPRNQIWLKRNPWFEADVIPALRRRVQQVLK